jgi:large subunit ribosomal protein L5
MNPMRKIRLEKLTLNVGAGEAGPTLEKAKLMLEKITNRKVVITHAHKRSTFGVPKAKAIGAKVTLRGNGAMEILKQLVSAVDNRLKPSQFDRNGNLSFGIHEYINIPGMKYDPEIGIMGFDVCVTLERPGFRVKKRAFRPSRIGSSHRITPEEAMEWAKKNLEVEVE